VIFFLIVLNFIQLSVAATDTENFGI